MSKNPVNRVRAVQNGNHETVMLRGMTDAAEGGVEPIEQVDALELEWHTHKILERRVQRRGEWFKTSYDDAVAALDEAWDFLIEQQARKRAQRAEKA